MPCQEAKFKEMTRYANLKVNHGFKKREVFNRMAANKLEKAKKSLNHVLSRVNSLQEKLEGVKRQIEKRRAQWEKASEKLKSQIETIHHKIREQRGDETKLMNALEKRNEEREEGEATYENKMVILRDKERELDMQKKQLAKSIERKREEVTKWEKELENTPFYELDTEMDHIMTDFKILHENALLFAKEVFFVGDVGMDLMIRQFINHYGDLEILDRGKRFRFRLNRFDGKGLTEKAAKACAIFNAMKIKTVDDILLEIVVKR
jgi:SMC interacting uncharacterized protein involved in chromosome segregation